jgi:gliding motility-associated-like protein
MKKNLFVLLALLSGFATLQTKASDAWAGGHIEIIPVATNQALNINTASCNTNLVYHIRLHYYRDQPQFVNPFPNTMPVTIYTATINNNPGPYPFNQGGFATVDLGFVGSNPVTQFCLSGTVNPTQGAIYQTTTPVTLPQRHQAWTFAFFGSEQNGEYRSVYDENLKQGQLFFIRTIYNNTHCGVFTGRWLSLNGPQVTVPAFGSMVDNQPPVNPVQTNRTVQFGYPPPVGAFCRGDNYEYELRAYDEPGENDRFEFQFFRPEYDVTRGVDYQLPIYSPTYPLPAKPFELDEEKGIITMKPTTNFSAIVGIEINEYKDGFRIDQQCPNPPCTDPSQLVDVIVPNPNGFLVSRTRREYRFIVDNQCVDRTPDFDIGEFTVPPNQLTPSFQSTYNATYDASEFDCATQIIYIELSEPVRCNTLDPFGYDAGLRFEWDGKFDNGKDTSFSRVKPFRVSAENCDNFGEFTLMRVEFNRPLQPGYHNFIIRRGEKDGNTLVNRCGQAVEENVQYGRIYVNDNYVYNHQPGGYDYCNTGDADTARVYLPGIQSLTNRLPDVYTWKFNGNNQGDPPITFYDKAEGGPSKISLRVNGKDYPGLWTVGVGADVGYRDPATGEQLITQVCYDEDDFFVEINQAPPVTYQFKDYDLCPNEDLPVIDLTAFAQQSGAKDFVWRQYDPDQNSIWDPTTWQVVDNFKAVHNTNASFREFKGNDYSLNRYYLKFQLPIIGSDPLEYCPKSDSFNILREKVTAELKAKSTSGLNPLNYDTSICETEQFVMVNDAKYYLPDQIDYQWTLDGNPVGIDTNIHEVTTSGKYKLQVTKTTANMVCTEKDSLFVNIFEKPVMSKPTCTQITYSNGRIEQTFFWPEIEGYNTYEVREIDQYGNYVTTEFDTARGQWGLHHTAIGPQKTIEVRAALTGVDDDAICKYSDTVWAEACEIIIKPVNVFTPNGDGINDLLRFDLLEVYPGSLLQIFNRWGEKIYEDPDYSNDWTGEDYKAGTYFYILHINDEETGEIRKGSFTIIRN